MTQVRTWYAMCTYVVRDVTYVVRDELCKQATRYQHYLGRPNPKVNGKSLKMELDTVSALAIISKRDFDEFFPG